MDHLLAKVLCVVLLLTSGCTSVVTKKYDNTYEQAHVAVTLAKFTAGERSPRPAPPDSKECSNCGGTGKVGDGRVFVDCPECGGDGIKDDFSASLPAWPGLSEQDITKVALATADEVDARLSPKLSPQGEPTPVQASASSTVYIYSAPGCAACERWKDECKQLLIDAGWVVEEREASSDRSAPYFEVYVGGEIIGVHDGYMEMEDLKKILEN
mgnify:CR=1 FL=1